MTDPDRDSPRGWPPTRARTGRPRAATRAAGGPLRVPPMPALRSRSDPRGARRARPRPLVRARGAARGRARAPPLPRPRGAPRRGSPRSSRRRPGARRCAAHGGPRGAGWPAVHPRGDHPAPPRGARSAGAARPGRIPSAWLFEPRAPRGTRCLAATARRPPRRSPRGPRRGRGATPCRCFPRHGPRPEAAGALPRGAPPSPPGDRARSFAPAPDHRSPDRPLGR